MLLAEEATPTALAFLAGAFLSVLLGGIGMVTATLANYRVVFAAKLAGPYAFRVAYRAACAVAFATPSLALLGKPLPTQPSPFSSSSTAATTPSKSTRPTTSLATTLPSSRPYQASD